MAKSQKRAGRPPSKNPLTVALRVRIDPAIKTAIEKYQTKYKDQAELAELSDAVRHILKRVLRDEGLL